jgi:hypothetical protein
VLFRSPARVFCFEVVTVTDAGYPCAPSGQSPVIQVPIGFTTAETVLDCGLQRKRNNTLPFAFRSLSRSLLGAPSAPARSRIELAATANRREMDECILSHHRVDEPETTVTMPRISAKFDSIPPVVLC